MGALFGSGGAVASGVAPTSGPALLGGAVSPDGVGGAAAGVPAGVPAGEGGAGVFPRISLSGIWWMSETATTREAPAAGVVSNVLPVASTDAPTKSSSPGPWSS